MSGLPGVPQPRPLPVRGRVSWMDLAECLGSRIEFVSDSADEAAAAQQVCARCPVRSDCLEYAVRWQVRGVWGGLTEQQRRAMAAAR